MVVSPLSGQTVSIRRIVALCVVVVGVLLLQIAAPTLASGPNGWIKGYVKDAATTAPLTGTIVRIEPEGLPWFYELTTDGAGYFAASVIPQMYSLILIEPAHRPYFASVGVGSLQTTWANVSLEAAAPRTATIHGYLNDTTNGAAIAIGRVVAIGPPMSQVLDYINASSPDVAGYYEMRLLPGSYQVFTDNITGYAGAAAFVTLIAGETRWLNFSLFPNPSDSWINGTATEAGTGTPLAGVTVYGAAGDLFLPSVTTDAAGDYSLPVPSGDVTVTANSVGYAPDTATIVVAPASEYVQDFVLRPILGSIRGYVKDSETDLPIANATVSANDTVGFYDQNRTTATGYYEIPVPSATFEMHASADGYALSTMFITLTPGEISWVNFTLLPLSATVQGYLIDASDGAHIPGLLVFAVHFVTGFFTFGTSNGTGFYSIATVATPTLLVGVPSQGNYAGGLAFTSTYAGKVTWANVTVFPLNATVRVNVTDAVTGAPISGATAKLAWSFLYNTTNATDSNGMADLSAPATTGVSISVSAAGYVDYFTTMTVSPGLNVVDVALYRVLPYDVHLQGFINDTAGSPIAGATVEVSGYDDLGTAGVTDGTGYYSVYIVAGTQQVRATKSGYASNATTVNPISGETLWVNLALAFDPDAPTIVRFAANPNASVSPTNPTLVWADILEKDLERADVSLLRLLNVSGSTRNFLVLSPVDPTAPSIVKPSSGRYNVSMTWDARAWGGWIKNATASEWWPVSVWTFPPAYAISGLWRNATESTFMGAFFDLTTGDLLFVANSTAAITGADQPDSTFTPVAMGLQVDVGTGSIVSGTPVFASSYPLAGLGLAYDEVVPTGMYGAWLQLYDAAGHYNGTTTFFDVDTTPPMADAGGPYTIQAGYALTFDGSGSTDNVGIKTYTWTFNDGAPRTLSGSSPSYRFTAPGVYVVTLTVDDVAGNSNAATAVITVTPDVTAPTANAGTDQTVGEDTVVTFNGGGSTDNVGVTNYTWTFTDGVTRTLFAVSPTYVFANPGTYVVTLTVRDAAGSTGTDTMTVTVRDTTNPTANAGPDRTVDEDTVVTFDGSGSSDNVGVVNYTWTFTDGSARTLYGVSPTYTFASPGTYDLTLTVRDAAGRTAADTMTVVVRDVTNPTVSIDSPASGVTVSGTITVTTTASDNVGVVRVELRIDGTLVATDSSAPFEFLVNTADYSDGSHTIRVTAYDAAGNSTSTERSLTFSNPVPTTGFGIVEYSAIAAILIVAAILVAWMLMRRRKRPTSAELAGETPATEEPSAETA